MEKKTTSTTSRTTTSTTSTTPTTSTMSTTMSRSVSRSTELLHIDRQESPGGRRSWDSLVAEKKKTTTPDSPSSPGPDRGRFSTYSAFQSPSATGNASWFGTMPRSILSLSERPATYEEELEDRLGLLRTSTSTLCQRLANEKKRNKELTNQLHVREQTYREVVEKTKGQYEQRFERLKNRARLLVTRCEFLRNEKHMVEQRLAQVVESTARERLALERKVCALQEELERARSEREIGEQELPVLRVTEETDLEEEEERMEKGKADRGHFRMLCEIAVARVAFLEEWIATSGHRKPSPTVEMVAPPLRRSSSCPMIPRHLLKDDLPTTPRFVSRAEREEASGHSTPTVPSSPSVTEPSMEDPTEVILRLKSSTTSTAALPGGKHLITTTRSVPLATTGYPKPARPSTSALRNSLQKLFTRPHSGDLTSNPHVTSPEVIARTETPSDDEFSREMLFTDGSTKRPRRPPKRYTGPTSLPASSKRHSSLPRGVDLFRKFQYTANRQTKESQLVTWYSDGRGVGGGLQTDGVLLTKQERVLGVPLTKQERVLGVPLTKQERVLGVRLDRSSSDKTFASVSASTSASADAFPGLSRSYRDPADNNSTESLPEKMDGLGKEEGVKVMKRNRSVHSSFGRLHQRRNGITDITSFEQKTTTRTSPSALDHFGKNLKQYLH